MNYTDTELLSLLNGRKKESNEAFKIIYNKYGGRLHAYCLRVLGNQQEAEDVFQETFIRFVKNNNPEKINTGIISYLITIARNLCLNKKRDIKYNIEFHELQHTQSEASLLEDTESKKIILDAIEKLDIDYKEPLILRIYENLSYKEISEICEISEQNARKRVFRAKEKLLNILKPYSSDLF